MFRLLLTKNFMGGKVNMTESHWTLSVRPLEQWFTHQSSRITVTSGAHLQSFCQQVGGGSLEVCIFNKLPGDAAPAGPRTTLWEPLPWGTQYNARRKADTQTF